MVWISWISAFKFVYLGYRVESVFLLLTKTIFIMPLTFFFSHKDLHSYILKWKLFKISKPKDKKFGSKHLMPALLDN